MGSSRGRRRCLADVQASISDKGASHAMGSVARPRAGPHQGPLRWAIHELRSPEKVPLVVPEAARVADGHRADSLFLRCCDKIGVGAATLRLEDVVPEGSPGGWSDTGFNGAYPTLLRSLGTREVPGTDDLHVAFRRP